MSLAVLALCVLTWGLSYASEPWTNPVDVWATGWQWVSAVEALSMLVTLAMFVAALRCLAALRHA